MISSLLDGQPETQQHSCSYILPGPRLPSQLHKVASWRRFGIVLTRCSRSTRLTYAEPG